MRCPKCKTELPVAADNCPGCGWEIAAPEEELLMEFRQGAHMRKAEERKRQEAAASHAPGYSGASRTFEQIRPLHAEGEDDPAGRISRRQSLDHTGRVYGITPEDVQQLHTAGPSQSSPITAERRRGKRTHRLKQKKRFINWVYVTIGLIVFAFLAFIGTYVFLMNTHIGQVLMARMGQDVTSAAMWQVGDEYFRTGDVDRAVEYYLIARQKDTEAEEPNLTGLLELGSAYEAQGNQPAAEEVYQYIYTEVDETSQEAYRSQVRVLLAQDKRPEAADLLKLAYQKTGQNNFRLQRLDILPEIPSPSVAPGYYTNAQTIKLIQGQYHQVYYTLNPFAALPDEGILYEDPIELSEGEHELRAVAVNNLENGTRLVSDELDIAYQIYLPTPLQPDANLAPNTYTKKRTVRLKPGKLTDEELVKNPGYAKTLDDPIAQTVTIYYTIDGSQPDRDSPIFDPNSDEAIQLPTGGYVELKAVSVNGYGKQGNTLTVTYKFDCKPYFKNKYGVDDAIAGLKLGATTRENFFSKYGTGEGPRVVRIEKIDADCHAYDYEWGSATFTLVKTGWVLAELDFTASFTGPRGTKIGATETDITSQFKDFGQVVGNTGVKRGLYYVDAEEKGEVQILSDGTRIVFYSFGTAEGHVWKLYYYIGTDGKCNRIQWLYEP